MTTARVTLVTSRDLEILRALDRTPLTARQLLKLSRVFAMPFQSERKVRARMHRLVRAERARCFPYLIAGRGSPNYYTLSRLGHQVIAGDETPLPPKRNFGPVGIARQQHTLALSDFIVHTAVSSHAANIDFTGFCRENSVCLSVGQDAFYPDCAFQLVTRQRREYSFFAELDNRTERVRSDKDTDSWERKIRLYEAVQDRTPKRFRVLIVTTGGIERLKRILAAVRELSRNLHRSLFYGVRIQDYLQLPLAVTTPCFLDHRGRPVALVPGSSAQLPLSQAVPSAVKASCVTLVVLLLFLVARCEAPHCERSPLHPSQAFGDLRG